jgi:hypothetical protein
MKAPRCHRSHIRRREGRPNRRKLGSKSLRRLGQLGPVGSTREASKSAGRSASEVGSHEIRPHGKWIVEESRVPRPFRTVEGQVSRAILLGSAARELSGVAEHNMSTQNISRKLGTTRGSPRRSRTAKASRITGTAGKSRRAREWGGWGRISVDGPGQNNPDRSEGPRGRAGCAARMAVLNRALCPTQSGTTGKATRSTNDGCKLRRGDGYAGSRLNRSSVEEGAVGKASLEAVLGKTRRTEF